MKAKQVKTRIGKEQPNLSGMAKTLVYIPRMFTREEFKELVGQVPEDFDRTANEFWRYVDEKLKAVSSRIHFVYSDSLLNEKRKSRFREESSIVEGLVKNGAKLQAVGDPSLVAEVKAWLEMAETSPSQVILELHAASLRELSKNIVDVIYQTLKKGEMGVLFINPLLKISFPQDLGVIRMLPFDPQDYLKRHQVKNKERKAG